MKVTIKPQMTHLPPKLSPKGMSEAEVALRLAFHLLSLPRSSSHVTVCLDHQHVKSKNKTVFPLKRFLASHGWTQITRSKKCSWHGRYSRNAQELVLESNSRGGDVIAKVGRRRIRAECKKGPLIKRDGNPENSLVHNAIGQLMTIERLDPNDVLIVAVPDTERFRAKRNWQARPLMQKAGISLVLVGRDGSVEGLPRLTKGNHK